jgi:hypothetical protein
VTVAQSKFKSRFGEIVQRDTGNRESRVPPFVARCQRCANKPPRHALITHVNKRYLCRSRLHALCITYVILTKLCNGMIAWTPRELERQTHGTGLFLCAALMRKAEITFTHPLFPYPYVD